MSQGLPVAERPPKFYGRSKIAQLVANSDYYPLRPVYRLIYHLGVMYLKERLLRLPGVLGIFVGGSYVLNEELHGVSDIDVYVIVENKHHGSETIKRYEDCFARCIKFFPFLGPVEERLTQLIFCDQDGFLRDSSLTYRYNAGLLMPLYQREGFAISSSDSPTVGIVHELTLQVQLVVKALARQEDNMYFWKARLKALTYALKYAGAILEQSTDAEFSTWLKRLLLADNRSLYVNRNEQELSKCVEAFWRLVSLGLNQLTPKLHDDIKIPLELGPDWSKHKACFSVIEDIPIEIATITADRLSREQLTRSLRGVVGQNDFLCTFEHFAVLFEGGYWRSTNRFAAPWIFSPLKDAAEITWQAPFWKTFLRQSEQALRQLQLSLFHKPSNLSFPDERQFIHAILCAYRLSLIGPEKIMLFNSENSILSYLGGNYPDYVEFIELLRNYYEVDAKPSLALPPNFLGFAIAFFRALIDKAPLPPPEDLHKRLSLSLCIITRDREEYLIKLLKSVVEQTRLPNELVIVDNSSSDKTKNVVEQFRDRLLIKYAFSKSHLIPELRNQAIAEATGEIVCFTDDDCVLAADWLELAEKAFLKDDRIAVVGGLVKHYRQSPASVIELFHETYLG